MIYPFLNQYNPDYIIPPGEILEETLEAKRMKKNEFADRCGLSAKTVSQIIKGIAPISPDSAIQFERVLNVDASIWNNLESNYRLFLAQKEDEKNLQDQKNWLNKFPVRELIRRKYIKKTDNELDTVKEILDFFGVAGIGIWESRFKKQEAVFRSSVAFNRDPVAVVTWLRMGEKIAENIECYPFNKNKFKSAIRKVRRFTVKSSEKFCAEMRNLFAEAGVAIVFLPELSNTRLFGATKWISSEKALIMNSLRYKTNDQFWFTIFHEAAHILLHGKKDEFIDDESKGKSDKEKEADLFAANVLINNKEYQIFANKGQFDKKCIIDFAETQEIAPGIVVGRLQHDRKIPFHSHNDLKKKFKFVNS